MKTILRKQISLFVTILSPFLPQPFLFQRSHRIMERINDIKHNQKIFAEVEVTQKLSLKNTREFIQTKVL